MKLSTYKDGIELILNDTSEQVHLIFRCDLFPGPTKEIDLFMTPVIRNQQLSLSVTFNENEFIVMQARKGNLHLFTHPAVDLQKLEEIKDEN